MENWCFLNSLTDKDIKENDIETIGKLEVLHYVEWDILWCYWYENACCGQPVEFDPHIWNNSPVVHMQYTRYHLKKQNTMRYFHLYIFTC